MTNRFRDAMIRALSIACALTLLPFATAAAQSAKANGEAVRALLENNQIKVREWRLKPRERAGAQNYPNTFLYGLTDGALVFTPPGRTPYELAFKAGEALWLPAQATAVSNETDKEVRTLVVELKERPPAVKTKGKAKSARKSAQAKAKNGARTKQQ